MSLIPFILDLADELNEFSRSFASGMDVDDFGFGMYPHELQQTSPRRSRTMSQLYWLPNNRGRHHPYCRGGGVSGGANSSNNSCNIGKSCCGRSSVTKDVPCLSEKENVTKSATTSGSTTAAYSVVNKNGFQVSMNVKQFSPNELTVKTIDNCVVVEGQHDEKEDGHGVISRHFIRKYMLPKGFDPNEVLSTLSSDGILTVKAPPPVKPEDKLERVVHIHQTGPAQLAKDVGATNKEKEKLQQSTSTTSTTQTLPIIQQPQQHNQLKQQHQTLLSQQHQQHQQQKRDEEKKNEVNERNGDSNLNEINEQQEKPETLLPTNTASTEPMILVGNIFTPAGIDATVCAASANSSAGDSTMEEKNEIDTNISDIPMADVSVPAGVIESIVLVTPDNGASDGVAAVGIINEAPSDNIVIPTPPSAGDLLAAADAATILLAKAQCENGNNATNEEELAN